MICHLLHSNGVEIVDSGKYDDVIDVDVIEAFVTFVAGKLSEDQSLAE